MGFCLDGLPLVLDLADWGVGSTLVAADDPSFLRRVIDMVIAAAEINNSKYNLCIQYISSGCAKNSSLLRSSASPEQTGLGEILDQLYMLMCQREEGRLRIPYHLLVIEHWRSVIERLPGGSVDQLMRLVAYGPFWGIWVMAGITSGELCEDFYEQVERFPSRVVGRVGDIQLARYFTGLPLAKLSGLKPNQAVVRVGEEVFSVVLPEPGLV